MRNSLILIIKINFSGQNRPQFHFHGIIWIHQVINDQYSITHKSIWYFQIECSMDRCKGLYFILSPIRSKDYLVWKLSGIYWYSLPLFCTEIPLWQEHEVMEIIHALEQTDLILCLSLSFIKFFIKICSKLSFLIFLIFMFLIDWWLPYSISLISVIHQHELFIGIYVSPRYNFFPCFL